MDDGTQDGGPQDAGPQDPGPQDPGPQDPGLGALAQLLGTWEGSGQGHYSTIEPFGYRERVTFEHPGKPFVEYRQWTRHADDGRPLHREFGYLRPVDGGTVELVLSQPTGFVEVHAGRFDAGVLDLRLVTLARTPTAKDVRSVRRRFVVDGDVLTYDLWMAHASDVEEHHLSARLERRADGGSA